MTQSHAFHVDLDLCVLNTVPSFPKEATHWGGLVNGKSACGGHIRAKFTSDLSIDLDFSMGFEQNSPQI